MGFLGKLFSTELEVPAERQFGWRLKAVSSSVFAAETTQSKQIVAVPVRGVTCEMIYWWFRHFPRMKVRLENVPGYEGDER